MVEERMGWEMGDGYGYRDKKGFVIRYCVVLFVVLVGYAVRARARWLALLENKVSRCHYGRLGETYDKCC